MLFSSISVYSAARMAEYPPQGMAPRSSSFDTSPTSDSVLFLRIRAAADYYSLDSSLMQIVPPVQADIILDPFLLNVFPQSLVPTACYMAVVGGFAAVLGWWILGQFTKAAESASVGQVGKEKKKR